jgi:hypothetical protein
MRRRFTEQSAETDGCLAARLLVVPAFIFAGGGGHVIGAGAARFSFLSQQLSKKS